MDLKHPESSLEERLDHINLALQNKMHELDLSIAHIRNPSVASYMHSYTTSFCNFDLLDIDIDPSKNFSKFEENMEKLLQNLDRVQMQLEDSFSDSHEKLSSNSLKQTDLYIQKLEKENSLLRASLSQGVQSTPQTKNLALEKEKKNFEEKLTELDFLITTYKSKHRKIAELEANLRAKERLLDQKEKQLKQSKEELDRTKKYCEDIIVSHTLDNKKKDLEVKIEEAPPPKVMTPDGKTDLTVLQEQLRELEDKYLVCDLNEKSGFVMMIDQVKNKIAAVRGEQVMLQCNKSSKVLRDMTKTIEKEVSYEEFLRKSKLEKFSVKGLSKNTPVSMTPSCSLKSKKFLFD